MVDFKDYAKFENMSELLESINIGSDIEFFLLGLRYNISWRDNRPFICQCPDGDAVFYSDAREMTEKHIVKGKRLKELWGDIEVISM